ncbi:elongation factor P maturation arginine rhamnosyltransferase EarP [Ramlibacter sp. MMS24-I3-19]|uniref:elongation factor P maturation arginine rhamnosyltransferase EarP n=1 Tax=Ramlibacter sp. MMS24-I3-19 TaxID=3416606 RepID=UPI003D0114ED
MRWDIFCKVIDNHGDIGVCWRLAADLADRGDTVRLWIDDAGALAWMAPAGQPGVEVLPWSAAHTAEPADAVIEAFGCELDEAFVAAIARATQARCRQPAWINLEYLSAEAWVERCHALPSPVLSGPGRGLVKRFFYPGFTSRTGGLLREPDLLRRQQEFDRAAWLTRHGIAWRGERVISLFCYEPPGLRRWFQSVAASGEPILLLVTPGRATAAMRSLIDAGEPTGAVTLHWLPALPQREYDHLLWASDFNFVRGEDSLVRALWAARPFAWHIYPQADGVHEAKLDAFLDWMQAPASLRQLHRAWNFGDVEPAEAAWVDWQAAVRQARERLLAQADLVTQLKAFVAG